MPGNDVLPVINYSLSTNALALELDRDATKTLLASAGFTLSESEISDLIITWCIDRGIYNLTEINQALGYFSQKTIGTYT